MHELLKDVLLVLTVMLSVFLLASDSDNMSVFIATKVIGLIPLATIFIYYKYVKKIG